MLVWCYITAVVVVLAPTVQCWDAEEMELFDVVEEVNQNFYEVLGISQDATLGEVKKAYRRLSLQLHPDKNDAPDAEEKFRQLVSIYDILRDEGQRARYNQVLVEGLPDWRSPIYYYRRARKMSMLEISVILTIVISITQYLMAWGSYIDRRHCLEESLMKKYKIKDRKKKKAEDLETISLMEAALGQIPKPSWWNILPVQLVRLVVFLVTGGPGLVRQILASIQEERERKLQEKKDEEEEERRRQEEEEKRREKKASRKEARKRVNVLPDFSNEDCLLEAVDGPESEGQRVKPVTPSVPVVTGGPWTDEDFCELARLMAKFPGGTVDRWERIADMMGRTVFEVTKMSSKVKARLMQRSSEVESEEIVPEVKVKVKTRAEKSDLSAGCDEMWNPIQQKALEKALKQNPKGTDQRWDKISRAVPDKTKEECMLRFKFLAEKIRKKKGEGSEKQDSEEPQEGRPQEETDVTLGGCDSKSLETKETGDKIQNLDHGFKEEDNCDRVSQLQGNESQD
ncbi:dnaJ homolog subfamily C member 1-like [Homarus americanus]|uniref:dnaJ homolog subfamily C member 1-like n=1 Tax=Homarus americanus TaxID=6706 RepID=UPI001C438166|nr:dnaJ homolog subfamily C member 1-like [Homarus americanus]